MMMILSIVGIQLCNTYNIAILINDMGFKISCFVCINIGTDSMFLIWFLVGTYIEVFTVGLIQFL